MRFIPKIIILIAVLTSFNKAHAVEFAVNTCPATTNLFEHMSSQVDDRILGVTASDSTKSLFSTRGNLTSSWVRNPSVWTNNISPIDFTGLSPWNSSGGYTKAGTLITPRHIAFANHFPLYVGNTVLFVAEDNTVVTRTITDTRRVLSTDIIIAKLNSDVPSSITHYPILDQSTFEKYLNDGFFQSVHNLPVVNLDQEDHATIHDTSLMDMYSNLRQSIFHYVSTLNAQRSTFYELLVGGDSGNSGFVLIGNKPVLILTHSGPGGGPSYSFYKNDVQTAIDSMGGNYTLSTINLSCFNSPIVLEPLAGLFVTSNSTTGNNVGAVGIKYNNENDTPYFSILNGNENNLFAISTSTGQITVASSTPFMNNNPSFLLEIGVAENSPAGRLSKGLYSVNFEPYPYFTVQNYNFNIDEHKPTSTIVGTVNAYDTQLNALRYSILSGNTSGIFSIASTTGVISVVDSSQLNYETLSNHTLIVEAKELNTPERLAKSIQVNININDINYTFASSSYVFQIDESDIDSTVVGTVQAQISDPNNISQINYSIISGNEKSIFSIDALTGQILINNNTGLDANDIYNLTVGVGDGMNAPVLITSNVTVKLTYNLRPTVSFGSIFSSLAWNNINEGSLLPLIFNLSSAYTKSIILNLHQTFGTVVLNSDYTLSTSTLVFLPGETEKSITLNALSDSVLENTEELVLGLVDGVRLTPGIRKSAFIKIIDKVSLLVSGGGGGGSFNTVQVAPSLKTIINNETLKTNLIKNLDTKLTIDTLTSNSQRGFGINTQGSDVKLLQQILNTQGFTVSKKGPGSRGNETDRFGPATKQALIKMQIKNKIFPATGYFGPKTKLFIKSLLLDK